MHRLGSAGAVGEVTLADGRQVASTSVRGVLNRLVQTAWDPGRVRSEDREYAAQELAAFYMSWLRCLPGPVLNPPTPQGLSGYWRHESEWAVLAAQAGLRTPPLSMGHGHAPGRWLFPDEEAADPTALSVVVVGDAVIGAAARPDVGNACRRLAHLSRTPLLGVDLLDDAHGSTFLHATPHPDLDVWGDDLLVALAGALRPQAPAAR